LTTGAAAYFLDLNESNPFRFSITHNWQRCQISIAGKALFPMIQIAKSERSQFDILSIALKITGYCRFS